MQGSVASDQPSPFLPVLDIDHDVALFDAPLREVIDTLSSATPALAEFEAAAWRGQKRTG